MSEICPELPHWPKFIEFVKAETATGGPDPQIALMNYLAKDYNPVEKVWLAGCYGAHHCVPSAYMVWNTFRPNEIIEEPRVLETWLETHWDKLPVRPEMRSHRMLEKRWKCLYDFASFAIRQTWADPEWTYMGMWEHSQANVKYFGRYMAIKYLEILRRDVLPNLEMPDLRAKGAWSPRLTLSWLYPAVTQLADHTDNSDEAEHLVNAYAKLTLETLGAHGLNITYFQLQVMLCEYREWLAGGYYPGASHDEELEYIKKARGVVDLTPIFDARKALFPASALKELQSEA